MFRYASHEFGRLKTVLYCQNIEYSLLDTQIVPGLEGEALQNIVSASLVEVDDI